MWQDCGLYWAWRGGHPMPPPPTEKRIAYAEVEAGNVKWRVAVDVFDDGRRAEVNRGEVDWLLRHGAVVVMPT